MDVAQLSFSSMPTQDNDTMGPNTEQKSTSFIKEDSFFKHGGLNLDGTANGKIIIIERL